MSNRTVWELEEHTLAKHELLRRYLQAWFPILANSRYNGRIIYLDGFAGPGIYAGGEPGSPLLALETLIHHSHYARMSHTEFVFAFVEQDIVRFHSLEHQLDSFWSRQGGQPDNISVHLYNTEFETVAQEITSSVRGRLAPTLAFVDPFGWSGVSMEVIRDLLSSKQCEVIFNFMLDSVNRFVTDTRPELEKSFAELFGTEDNVYHQAAELNGVQRREFLRDLYLQQLRVVGNFKFVRSFEIIDQGRNRTAYYLMFGTRDQKGLRVMKDAMWVVDPEHGRCFIGFGGSQLSLFPPVADLVPLKKVLLDRFEKKMVKVEDIENFVVEETDFKATHYKGVLKEFEVQGMVVCVSERKRRNTYPSGTVLRFEPQP